MELPTKTEFEVRVPVSYLDGYDPAQLAAMVIERMYYDIDNEPDLARFAGINVDAVYLAGLFGSSLVCSGTQASFRSGDNREFVHNIDISTADGTDQRNSSKEKEWVLHWVTELT